MGRPYECNESDNLSSGKGYRAYQGGRSLLGTEEITAFREAVAECIAGKASKLLIDLGGVDYMNSTRSVCFSAFTSYTRRNWQLKLCGMNKAVNSILAITKLNLLFDTADTPTDAVAKFAG